jgi:hypothetical protein
MAESKDTMKRLSRLEGAIVHMTDAIVLQGERLDGLRDEMREVRGEVRAVRDEMRGVRDGVSQVTERLDRLIAITIKERTASVERLANIEQRLELLEEHVGI